MYSQLPLSPFQSIIHHYLVRPESTSKDRKQLTVQPYSNPFSAVCWAHDKDPKSWLEGLALALLTCPASSSTTHRHLHPLQPLWSTFTLLNVQNPSAPQRFCIPHFLCLEINTQHSVPSPLKPHTCLVTGRSYAECALTPRLGQISLFEAPIASWSSPL